GRHRQEARVGRGEAGVQQPRGGQPLGEAGLPQGVGGLKSRPLAEQAAYLPYFLPTQNRARDVLRKILPPATAAEGPSSPAPSRRSTASTSGFGPARIT